MSEQNDFNLSSENREKVIIRTSIIGIATNVLLVLFKMFVGVLSNSIAVILDAVNNLSDALSSVVTIIGAKLGAKLPDRKHPLGYGRIEYLSSMMVAALVLYAGITSMVESIKKIIHPEAAEYGTVSMIIISVAIAAKLILGLYVKKQGNKVNSGALVASGSDALFDAILSSSVLACAIIFLVFGFSLEAYVGVLIACFIIKAGIELMMETLSDIIGRREDASLVNELKRIIREEDGVRGAYDITLYNYGPNKNYGTVHIELPDTLTVNEVDKITRKVQAKVFQKTGIILTGIGVYSYNTSNDEAAQMRDRIQKEVLKNDWALQMHGFYVDFEKKTIRFDVVVTFDIDREVATEAINNAVNNLYPDYVPTVVLDADISDL